MRLFDPNTAALQALKGSGISVILGIQNQDLPALAASQEAVNAWFTTNVEPYLDGIELSYIAVGNEVIPGPLGNYVFPVMRFLRTMLDGRELTGIKVTTVVPGTALGSSYPPSSGVFAAEAVEVMTSIVQFIASTNSSLMINAYPYFAYKSDPANVHLDYALFTIKTSVIQDGPLGYYNLLDAIVDSFYTAMEKVGGPNVTVVVSESGWPSAGSGQFTTPELAGTYNRNFIKHISSRVGTPKRPDQFIEGYIFAMFNENQKPEGEEQHFGLFCPNMEPVYPVF
ncbi:probable glucan endo-1,3-beta-glucosidase BG5 [Rosa rugosa]|uniref:probable glucan endo-1,3-beta-glucosidase BG5 n=1 Tax=Rosa rugosa TaxID=74645 RepID=UPI002B40419D|nr:probable glucan endo-1,3-beta-glucosidase BG5 [Rosa rugosa]